MEPFQPDLIITNCPGCPYFLDRWQYVIAESTGKTYGENGHGIPVLTYEEVAGLVLGYDPWDLARKYLGKNGKDIGRPGECMYLK